MITGIQIRGYSSSSDICSRKNLFVDNCENDFLVRLAIGDEFVYVNRSELEDALRAILNSGARR